MTPSCTSRRHGRTFSSSCAYVHVFMLPHVLYTGWLFSEFKGISNTHSSLGFGIPLLLRLILFAFPMLILLVVGLTEIALLLHVIFLDLLLFASLLENNLQLLNPPQRLSM
jgi:hypothetical protein